MNVQGYPRELNYINAKLKERVGGFLETFFLACTRADAQNYEIIRPALWELMKKYPARPEFLAAEVRD